MLLISILFIIFIIVNTENQVELDVKNDKMALLYEKKDLIIEKNKEKEEIVAKMRFVFVPTIKTEFIFALSVFGECIRNGKISILSQIHSLSSHETYFLFQPFK